MWTNETIGALSEKLGYEVQTIDDVLIVSNEEDLKLSVFADEEQILLESVLAPIAGVKDLAALNMAILKTHHKLFPLAHVAINTLEGADYYVATGAISSECTENTLTIEIESLFENVVAMLDVYGEMFA
jgi:uncharacterized protein YjfI (DUF2170 family)